MKTFTKTIYTLFFAMALFMTGSMVSHAASYSGGGQFDPDPAVSDGGTNYTGFLSIENGNACSNCANEHNSISVDIPTPGETERFTLYLDYRNKGTDPIYNVKALMNVNNASALRGTLSGSGASSITDTAKITNLPDDYAIDFVSAYVENTHGDTDPNECSGYNYYANASENQVLNSGVPLGTLDTQFNGWCDQGYVIATFEIENTGTIVIDPSLDVATNNASNISEESAQLNGEVIEGDNANVWFALTTGTTPNCNSSNQRIDVNGNYDSGDAFDKNVYDLQPQTTYRYRACAEQGSLSDEGSVKTFTTESVVIIDPDLDIQTRTPNVDDNDATLRGRVNEGNNVEVWFAFDDTNNLSCYNYSQRINVGTGYDAGDSFDADVDNLQPDTYYYMACGKTGTQQDHGLVEQFQINDTTGGGGDDLTVDTLDATNINENSARLNGLVTNGETNYVYFTWGYDNSSDNLDCQNATRPLVFADNFNDPRNEGDEFHADFGGLLANTDYKYQACAREVGVTNVDIVSGGIEYFSTDDTNTGGGDRKPDANTLRPRSVDEDSAKLRGEIDMNDFDDGIVFFVYGQDEYRIEDVERNYDSYDEVRDDRSRDRFEVVFVQDDFDGDTDFEERVRGLEEDQDYYYQICVEYEKRNGNDTLACGGVRDFNTDDDGGNSNDIEIETRNPRNVTRTTAEMCAELIDDGGSSVQTWIDFRPTGQNYYEHTPTRQRGEVLFCEHVSGLQPNTTYLYRGCTEEGCAGTRSFRTQGDVIPTGRAPIIITNNPTNIRSNRATLNGTYVANAPTGTCWFNYGRTSALGRRTRSYNVTGYGACTHNFTNLASNTRYCVQAMINTRYGTDTGSVQCFNTPPRTGGPTPPPVVVIDDDTDIDLSSLGLGLSLVRLEIDNDQEVVAEGQRVEYTVEWQNISELDLSDLDLKITLPPEVEVTNYSRGRFDAERNVVYYTINDLEGADFDRDIPGERGEMSISGIVGNIKIGNLVTAEAELSYDNPVNKAKESAIDFDVDEAGLRVAGATASVFGLTNITFLGWLVILLGLFIIFLVARWLYLDREELRAQAYGNGYGGYNPPPTAYGDGRGYSPQDSQNYNAQSGYTPPPAPTARDDYYEPYRPNRG